MAPSPLSPALADPADNPTNSPPELSDADYLRQVLLVQPGDNRSEGDIDRELIEKASVLGVELPIGTRLDDGDDDDGGPNYTSAAESDDTLIIQHGRTISTSSNATSNSGLTSRQSAVIPATLTESATARRRSRSLTFSHYEKYLGQINQALDQPRFQRPNAEKTERYGGLLRRSGSTRKGVQELKRSITNRLKKRKPNPSSATPMQVTLFLFFISPRVFVTNATQPLYLLSRRLFERKQYSSNVAMRPQLLPRLSRGHDRSVNDGRVKNAAEMLHPADP